MDAKEVQGYAWNWFVYHAGQRITAFQIFLVFLGALAVGLSYSLEHGNFFLMSVVSLAAAFISVAFLILEIRNEKLVKVGRDALLKVEESKEFNAFPPEYKLFHVDQHCGLLLRHKFWFRLIYGLCIGAFLWLAYKPTFLSSSDKKSEPQAVQSTSP